MANAPTNDRSTNATTVINYLRGQRGELDQAIQYARVTLVIALAGALAWGFIGWVMNFTGNPPFVGLLIRHAWALFAGWGLRQFLNLRRYADKSAAIDRATAAAESLASVSAAA